MGTRSHTGIFEANSDIGKVKFNGAAQYEPKADRYLLKGAGANLWFNNDEFHFLWKRISGDFTIYTWLEWLSKSEEPHRKGGLIIRESLDPNSRYVSAAYHGDGLVSMQYRLEPDSMTQEFQAPARFLSILLLEKSGNTIRMSATDKGNPLQKVGELTMSFSQPEIYVGLFVCAHNPDVVEEAAFLNTRLTIPAKADFKPYQDYIGCRLELLAVATGLRKVIYQSQQPFEAPNWSRDGKYLIFNSKGLIYRIPVTGGKPKLINSDFAIANNNDHGLSPDGTQLAISHHANDRPAGENSVIYIMPAKGGFPKQITDKSPSYWHGWSPDGKYLIYTAQRNEQWDVYRIPVTGGDELQLTNNSFLDDGSEYSPDGKQIWFNSNRTGTMEIWRMNADGSEQIQITDDPYQNWFPHQSPDGKWLVFLSYPPEVNSGDHPYFKPVMLRLMNLSDGAITVIAHLYGGQGTINVPSWSPDSKQVAFVSNSDRVGE